MKPARSERMGSVERMGRYAGHEDVSCVQRMEDLISTRGKEGHQTANASTSPPINNDVLIDILFRTMGIVSWIGGIFPSFLFSFFLSFSLSFSRFFSDKMPSTPMNRKPKLALGS